MRFLKSLRETREEKKWSNHGKGSIQKDYNPIGSSRFGGEGEIFAFTRVDGIF
jgi:hypothetical protein